MLLLNFIAEMNLFLVQEIFATETIVILFSSTILQVRLITFLYGVYLSVVEALSFESNPRNLMQLNLLSEALVSSGDYK